MWDLIWVLLASIPFVTGLTFVLLGFRERRQTLTIQERAEGSRR